MRLAVISIPLFLAFAQPATSQSEAPMPMMRSVQPDTGKIGDVLVVEGENLGPETVAALYLTDGTVDIKAQIVDQTAGSISFRIPIGAKPGRLGLMVLTTEKPRRLIEEPVKITVEPAT
jgi:hypothetical protein